MKPKLFKLRGEWVCICTCKMHDMVYTVIGYGFSPKTAYGDFVKSKEEVDIYIEELYDEDTLND